MERNTDLLELYIDHKQQLKNQYITDKYNYFQLLKRNISLIYQLEKKLYYFVII